MKCTLHSHPEPALCHWVEWQSSESECCMLVQWPSGKLHSYSWLLCASTPLLSLVQVSFQMNSNIIWFNSLVCVNLLKKMMHFFNCLGFFCVYIFGNFHFFWSTVNVKMLMSAALMKHKHKQWEQFRGPGVLSETKPTVNKLSNSAQLLWCKSFTYNDSYLLIISGCFKNSDTKTVVLLHKITFKLPALCSSGGGCYYSAIK